MLKTFAFTLDLEKPELLATKINVALADYNVIEFTISLIQDGAPFDLTGRDVLLLTKLSTTVYKTVCDILDGPAGKLKVMLPTEANNKIGLFTAELAIMEGEEQRAIPNQFNYTVRSSIFVDNALEATNPIQPIHQTFFDRS